MSRSYTQPLYHAGGLEDDFEVKYLIKSEVSTNQIPLQSTLLVMKRVMRNQIKFTFQQILLVPLDMQLTKKEIYSLLGL
jgi:hypothetical protein